MAKHDPRGRTKSEARHTRLPHLMTGSPAWLDLSGSAVKVLIALQRLDHGGDNGALFFGSRGAAEAAGLNKNTVSRALIELEQHGFVAAVTRGHFKVKGGPATTWRLTFCSAPVCSMTASNEWQRWAPPAKGNKTRSQKLTATVLVSDQRAGNAVSMVPNSSTAMTETSHVSVSRAVPIIGTQLVCHRQGLRRGSVSTSKQGNSMSGLALETVGPDLLDDLRSSVASHLEEAGVGAKTRLALAANVPGGTLSKFLAGRGLSRHHFIALQLALPKVAGPTQRGKVAA